MVFAVLRALPGSVEFPVKLLKLDYNVPVRIGKAHKHEAVSKQNGLFQIEQNYISYKHAFLKLTEGQIYCEDASTFGTYVNKTKIGMGNSESQKFQDECQNLFHMYLEPPQYSFPLESIYSAVFERFKVLLLLNNFGEVEFTRRTGIYSMIKDLEKHGFLRTYNAIKRELRTAEECYRCFREDHIAHFILKIACCRNFPLRRWFSKQELKLLFIKWHFLTYNERTQIVDNLFNVSKIDEFEILQLSKKYNEFINPKQDYYNIFFIEASQLIKCKHLIVHNGIAFISLDDMISPIMSKLEKIFCDSMMIAKKNLHKIWEDKRITSILHYIEHNVHFDRYSFSQKQARVQPKDIEKLASESFPLCMNVLHYYLLKDHHLRNGGRYQYSLFLKGIGVSLQNALLFWRHHFTRKIDVMTFMRQYSYHVRHVYGNVGKMADYPPQNCLDILKANPGPLEYHGCPYKILDKRNMMSTLARNGISKKDSLEIWDIAEKGLPQLACSKYFEITHGVSHKEIITHPNLYFVNSRKIRTAEKGQKVDCLLEEVHCMNNCHENLEW